jgi:hypothetical protein
MNDQLNDRTVVILPGSADGLRGPARSIALTAEARVFSAALAGMTERLHLFEADGRIMLLAEGGFHVVNGEILTEIIHANLVRKGVRNAGTAASPVYEIAYTGVEANALTLRIMLTEPPEKGGLAGRLPVVALEELQPRRMAVETAAGD